MLYIICILIVTIAPTCFLEIYIYQKDVYEKEPMKLLVLLFLAGFLSVILTVILSMVLGTIFPFFLAEPEMVSYYSLPEIFIYTFIGVALIEEFSKWFFVKKITWSHKEFNYLYDAIVYCVFVSLGFATIENVLYTVQIATVKNVLLRAIFAVPGHAFNGIFMGYNLGKAKYFRLMGDFAKSRKYLIYSILIPALLHGIYDFLVFAEASYGVFLWIFIAFILFLYIASYLCIKKVSKNDIRFYNCK